MKPAYRHLSERQNHRCCYCGHVMIYHVHYDGTPTPRNAATKDHFEPRTYGGATNFQNLIVACYQCNHLRGEMEAVAFFNLIQKWFKRDVTLRERWHHVKREELYAFGLHCYDVHKRQLRGRAKRYIEYAFRHYVFIGQRRYQFRA